MPRSLKIKFTVVFTAALTFTLLIFSVILYGLINQKRPGGMHQRMSVIMQENPQYRQRWYVFQPDDTELLVGLGELVEAQQRQTYNKTLLMLLIPTIILSGLLSYGVAVYLVNPIENLREEVEKLKVSDRHSRLPEKTSSTEIEYLQKSFNSLLDSVESAFTAQEEFIQDAAHELRTPLASIKAQIELLRDSKDLSREELIEYINTLADMNESLIDLSEDLLYLDRRNTLTKKRIDLKDLIEEVI